MNLEFATDALYESGWTQPAFGGQVCRHEDGRLYPTPASVKSEFVRA